MASNPGKDFEKAFKDSVPDNVYYYRIQDTATGWTSSEGSSARFTQTNKFDCFMFKQFLFPIELKSTQGTAISFKGRSPMIKEHQIKELTKASNYKDILPGFIFNFRKVNKTYFLHIKNFNKFTSETTKSSINMKDIIEYGGIEIKSELKRTRYRYDIDGFINLFTKDN